jgi:beta-1,4-mannosyl-glycoprotein beta-1,4-N-acetylglucosaminyltransferase
LRKIYDCFLFWREFNALEIRLNELYEVVDKFLIVECSQGHTGKIKPFYLKENFEKFSKFSDKISLISINTNIANKHPLAIAHAQRKILDQTLFSFNPSQNDLILTSDSDEIVRADCLSEYKKSKISKLDLLFELDLYNNYLNNYMGKWKRPRLKTFNSFRSFSHSYRDIYLHENFKHRRIKKIPLMRVDRFFSANRFDQTIGSWVGFTEKKLEIIKNSGWHFSKLYSLGDNIEHMLNTPHIEFANATPDEIVRRIAQNQSGYGPLVQGKIVDIDLSYPNFVNKNIEKFSSLILGERRA